jgi:hypothetical protein
VGDHCERASMLAKERETQEFHCEFLIFFLQRRPQGVRTLTKLSVGHSNTVSPWVLNEPPALAHAMGATE